MISTLLWWSDGKASSVFQVDRGLLSDRCYRVESSRDRASGGTGLGLAITARAVKLHGGTVKANNAVDSHLEIVIVLPLLGD